MAQKERDMIEIDLLKLVLILWRKAWAIVLAMIVMGGIAFGVTYNFIEPEYQASVKVYVNNTNDIIKEYCEYYGVPLYVI